MAETYPLYWPEGWKRTESWRRERHPDAGGTHDAMTKLNIARDQALNARKG